MRDKRSVQMPRSVAALAAVALLAAGGSGTYLFLSRRDVAPTAADGQSGTTAAAETPAAAGQTAGVTPFPEVTITLTQEAIDRAGIRVAPVTVGESQRGVRVPGVVEANAYKQVAVTPLVSGRVTRVLVALGDRVRSGETTAEVYSPELADAQTQYLSFAAEFEAAHQQLLRTERLVEIGAASRQELERIRSEHAGHASHVEGARSKLTLLGMSPEQTKRLSAASEITATTLVPAPLAGVVTEREANVGLNVDPSTKLFTVIDLSTVWVVGDLYEKDFPHVRVGAPATITTSAYPELALQGRVSYIDPRVSAETRTARVRVEVGNPRGNLRLGMYAQMELRAEVTSKVAVVPRTAVQTVGDRHVVYVVNAMDRGRFVEREVRLGEAAGDRVEVISGVRPGDIVVAEGSFFLRAERERLGLRQAAPSGNATPRGVAPSVSSNRPPTEIQAARIIVSGTAFEPAKLTLRASVPARVTFLRTSERSCATEVVFPSLNIRRPLPLNRPVDVELTPEKTGEIAFACGMRMFSGSIVVR